MYLTILLLLFLGIFVFNFLTVANSRFGQTVWVALQAVHAVVLFILIAVGGLLVIQSRASLFRWSNLVAPSKLLFGMGAFLPFHIWTSSLHVLSQLNLVYALLAFELPVIFQLHLSYGMTITGCALRFLALSLICWGDTMKEGTGRNVLIILHALFFLAVIVMLYLLQKNNCEIFILHEKLKLELKTKTEVRAELLKRQYFKQMIHEIGTPLQVLMLGNDTIAHAAEACPEIVEINTECKRAVEMLIRFRERVLDVTRQENGVALAPNIKAFNVRHLVYTRCRQVMTAYNSSHGKKQVVTSYKVEENVPRTVYSDADFIWDMLCCLLSNAKKYTQEGSISTIVNYDEENNCLCFEVWDTGIGVHPNNHDKLFCPFSQFQTDAGGTGLGLFSVKMKAEALGGSAGYVDRTKKGDGLVQGSVFWFTVANRVPSTPNHSQGSSLSNGSDKTGTQISLPSKQEKRSFRVKLPAMPSTRTKLVTEAPHSERSTKSSMRPSQTFIQMLRMSSKSTKFNKVSSFSPLCEDARIQLSSRRMSSRGMSSRRSSRSRGSRKVSENVRTLKSKSSKNGSQYELQPGKTSLNLDSPDATTGSHLFTSSEEGGFFAGQAVNVCERHSITSASSGEIINKELQLTSQRKRIQTDPGCGSTLPKRKSPPSAASSLVLESITGDRAGVHHSRSGLSMEKSQDSDTLESPSIYVDSCSNTPKKIILVIEDEKMILKMLTKMISTKGYEVEVAENGEVGLSKLKQKQYHCVFCDLTMPVMDGYETLEKLREWERSTRQSQDHQYVCALSANTDGVSRQKALVSGFDHFVSKPASIKMLLSVIENRPHN